MFQHFDGVPPSNLLKDSHPYSTLEHQILDIILPFSIALSVVSSLKGKYNLGRWNVWIKKWRNECITKDCFLRVSDHVLIIILAVVHPRLFTNNQYLASHRQSHYVSLNLKPLSWWAHGDYYLKIGRFSFIKFLPVLVHFKQIISRKYCWLRDHLMAVK